MTNTQSSYVLTLVNDYDFYQAVMQDGYTIVYLRASKLYNAHHTKDGLTTQERYATIAEAIDYLTTD